MTSLRPKASLRRRARGLSAIALAGVLTLTACGGSDDSGASDDASVSTDAAPGDTVPEGVTLAADQELTMAVSNMQSSPDPHVVQGGGGRRWDMYETLLDQHPTTGEVRPFLATEWEQLDDLTYRFTLREDAVFHDGTPMTAKDVVFSLERAATQGYATAASFNTFASATAVDDYTVDVVTDQVDALFLKKIASMAILPMDYYMSLGADDAARKAAFAKAPVGTGPYKFVSYTPERAEVEVAADTTWRNPTLTKVTILQTPDTGTQLNSLLSGDVQYVNLMPLTSVETLEGGGATIVQLSAGNDLGAFIDSVNKDGSPKTGPTGNKLVRQAMNYALNKTELTEDVLLGQAKNDQGQMIGEGLPGYNSDVTEYEYDPELAEEMLDEAGYPRGADGTRFTVTMASAFAGPGSVRLLIGQYMVQALEDVGIAVEYEAVTDPTKQSNYFYNREQRPDILHYGLFTRPFLDAARAYNYFTVGSNMQHMDNPEFDQLYVEQGLETDPEARDEILQEMTAILHDEATFLFATTDVWIDAGGPKLRGLTQNDVQTEQYLDLLYFVE
jgi:peptide/nickel transport system substrate-binding protein